jgi:hypothetical protein
MAQVPASYINIILGIFIFLFFFNICFLRSLPDLVQFLVTLNVNNIGGFVFIVHIIIIIIIIMYSYFFCVFFRNILHKYDLS